MNKILVLLPLATLLILSCQQKVNTSSGKNADQVFAESNFSRLNPKLKTITDDLKTYRGHAASLIDSRSKAEGDYSFLVVGYWIYEFVFSGGSMSQEGEFDGHWIDFQEGFRYEYGRYDQTAGSGRYHYKLDDSKLIMLDDDPNVMPQEWEIKTKDDVMILIGSDYFGNNSRQAKLNKSQTLPVAS